MKTERKGLKEIVKEAAVSIGLASSLYVPFAALMYILPHEERSQQQSLQVYPYPELDLGNMNWAKYVLIR